MTDSPIYIAGMHRSGTSMVARLFNLCGVYLGDQSELFAPSPDNPEGYWEHQAFHGLNDEILDKLEGSWDWPPETAEGWECEPEMEELRRRAQELVASFEGHPIWGWKDPRNSLTLPFWKSILGDLRVVICVRHPLEVAHSLSARGYASTRFGLNLWQIYNRRLLAMVPPNARVVTHYDAYFDDPRAELTRVFARLGIPVSGPALDAACATINRSLRHSRMTASELVGRAPAALLEMYLNLCAEAGLLEGITLPAREWNQEPDRPVAGDGEQPDLERGPNSMPQVSDMSGTTAQGKYQSTGELGLAALLVDAQANLRERDRQLLEQRTLLDGQQARLEQQQEQMNQQQASLDQQRALLARQKEELAAVQAELAHMRATRVWRIGEAYWRAQAWLTGRFHS